MKFLKLLTVFFIVAGCSDLTAVGQVPEMTPVGYDGSAVITPERAAIAVPPPSVPRQSYNQASLWNSGPASLFGDRRARTLGDILTVVIEIDDRAQMSNSSTRNRAGSETMSIGALLGLPESLADGFFPPGTSLDPAADFSSNSTSSGDGNVSRNEKITLRVAATVVEVLDNGHLVVMGLQEVRVNYELRELHVAGIVRPEDVSRLNEITYDKIAGARISYGGAGEIMQMQRPRYGQQIFEILSPF